ncbi:HAD family hydrolase [Aestuariimicrobium ganziense]|uniref:HAD family hydrolase n=1 Tax=Aestuariimicrobium ganziense TaxID=2773677 RepID=UPI0019424BB7|nr:HAD family hydrolase [Aestuariimicrobium ganziense]
MAWRPQLIALDIDGTLLDFDGTLPGHVTQAVRRVVDAGTPVVLATGRGWYSTQGIHEALALPKGPAVCSNGAVVVEHPPFRLLSVETFDPGPVIRRVNELHPQAAIAVEVVGRGYRLNKPFPQGDLTGELHYQSLDDLCAEPVSRVVVRDPEAEREAFFALADQIGMHSVSYAIGWSTWLDLAPEGITKAHALNRVTADLGIAADDVLAIGDGLNDLEMLHWAGRGVAMGDAPDEVKDAADHVTGLFAEQGTATELGLWF